MPDPSKQSVGRYQIIEVIGEGGMAIVYKAYDPRLDRIVAVKVIRTDQSFLNSETTFNRFEQEAKALAKLSRHPNIVSILDSGEHEGLPYLVQEYLPGGTLGQIMMDPVVWQEAVKILIPITKGLSHAHGRGIIHRDIKPSNILFNEDGEPVLADFGISKLLEAIEMRPPTRPGMGTPGYMAPEQWAGSKVDPRTDVYSLGAVLYEMITGQRPYELMADDFTAPFPDPQKFIPNLPKSFKKILLKAVEPLPTDRHQDMNAFQRALEDLIIDINNQPDNLKQKAQALSKIQTERHKSKTKANKSDAKTESSRPLNDTAKTLRRWWVEIIIAGIGAIATIVSILPNIGQNPRPSETPSPQVVNTATVRIPTSSFTPSVTPTVTASATPMKRPPPLTPYPTETKDAQGVIMRLVRESNFIMGSASGNSDEQPIVTIYLDPFYIDQYEVTNTLYQLCVAANVCQPPKENRSYTRPTYYGNSAYNNFPVIYVDWDMAKAYCEWRGARLPTEAEWEKAASWDNENQKKNTYPWGEGLDCLHANYGKTNQGSCRRDTSIVGSYQIGQSLYGVYDMAGNVSEWVADWYQANYYTILVDAFINPLSPENGTVRVIRGGSWSINDNDVRATNRNGLPPSTATEYIGFRCAQTP